VNLDAIETGGERVARALLEGCDDAGNFIRLERPRRLVGNHLAVRAHGLELGRDRHRGGRDRQRAAGLE
jgi:hypothetical protein